MSVSNHQRKGNIFEGFLKFSGVALFVPLISSLAGLAIALTFNHDANRRAKEAPSLAKIASYFQSSPSSPLTLVSYLEKSGRRQAVIGTRNMAFTSDHPLVINGDSREIHLYEYYHDGLIAVKASKSGKIQINYPRYRGNQFYLLKTLCITGMIYLGILVLAALFCLQLYFKRRKKS
jgi:hypothetical protein